jgi:hypothetical protein
VVGIGPKLAISARERCREGSATYLKIWRRAGAPLDGLFVDLARNQPKRHTHRVVA